METAPCGIISFNFSASHNWWRLIMWKDREVSQGGANKLYVCVRQTSKLRSRNRWYGEEKAPTPSSSTRQSSLSCRRKHHHWQFVLITSLTSVTTRRGFSLSGGEQKEEGTFEAKDKAMEVCDTRRTGYIQRSETAVLGLIEDLKLSTKVGFSYPCCLALWLKMMLRLFCLLRDTKEIV